MTGKVKALDPRTVAFFSSADDAYVPACVVALRSFRRWFPECSYFLLGTPAAMSGRSLDLLERYEIGLIDIDETDRFVRPLYKEANAPERVLPSEAFYIFKGPETLAERGFAYSVALDGDVFCRRDFDLGAALQGVRGFRARPVRTLARTLDWKSRQPFGHGAFTFTKDTVQRVLGIDQEMLATNYEVNTGVVFWNNAAAGEDRLFEAATRVFAACGGCFEHDQDLLAFVAATSRIPFAELTDAYNFAFFVDSLRPDHNLWKQVRIGNLREICIVHFCSQKPWQRQDRWTHQPPPSIVSSFVNDWRHFVLSELGDAAPDLFDDLSDARVRYPISPFWNLLRRVRSGGGRW